MNTKTARIGAKDLVTIGIWQQNGKHPQFAWHHFDATQDIPPKG